MIGYSSKENIAGRSDSNERSLDVVCDLLAHKRRQYTLACLIDHTHPIALTELAEDVAIRENEKPLTEIPTETVNAISMSFHHVHIPKLVDTGVVEYEEERNLVRVSENIQLVEQVLSLGAAGEERQ